MGSKAFNSGSQSLTKESATTDQLHVLLDVMGGLHSLIAAPPADIIGNQQPSAIDGGAKMAAETSLVGVCSRIDAILADASRWSVGQYDEFLNSALALQAQQLQLTKAQTVAVEEMNTPHARAKPTIFRLGSGGWAAVAGAAIDHAIVATGSTPEEALVAFDLVFTGHLPAQTVHWLTERERAVADGTAKELDNKVNYEKQAVDGSGSSTTQDTKGRGCDVPDNRKDTQKKPKVRRGKNGKGGHAS